MMPGQLDDVIASPILSSGNPSSSETKTEFALVRGLRFVVAAVGGLFAFVFIFLPLIVGLLIPVLPFIGWHILVGKAVLRTVPGLRGYEKTLCPEDVTSKFLEANIPRYREVFVVLVWATVAASIVVLISLNGPWGGIAVYAVIVGALTIGLVVHSLVLFFPARLQRFVYEELSRRGAPHCVACGYDIKGGFGKRCSECGTLNMMISSSRELGGL